MATGAGHWDGQDLRKSTLKGRGRRGPSRKLVGPLEMVPELRGRIGGAKSKEAKEERATKKWEGKKKKGEDRLS